MNRRSWMIFGTIITVMALIGIIGVTAASLNDSETSSDDIVRAINWYDYSYVYRKSITITNSAALTDYQLKMTIDTSGAHFQALNQDLRFTTSDGVTEIYYWIESGVKTASTVIWVKIPSVLASPSSTTIYMYYGYASAPVTAYQSADGVFIFFDDFESYPFTKWTPSGTGTFLQSTPAAAPHGTYAARFSDTANTDSFNVTSSTFTAPNPVIVEFYEYPEQTNLNMETRLQNGTTIGPNIRFNSSPNINIRYNSAGTWTDIGAPAGYAVNTWYNYKLDEIRWVAGAANDTFDIYVGDTLRNNNVRYRAELDTVIDRIVLIPSANNQQVKMQIDFVKVRVYTVNTVTPTVGSEEPL